MSETFTAADNPPDPRFHVYDTTLRDGTQGAGFTPSIGDKLAVARHLDDLGFGYLEGGWPGSNPKDAGFFTNAATELELRHATLCAFGATRRASMKAVDDPQVLALLDANTKVVTLVAKAHSTQVERALRTTRDENLAMVADTVSLLRAEGRRVFVDAEHFFDGFRHDPAYALSVVTAAQEAGAEVVVLCDTNGGMLPHQVAATVAETLTMRPGGRLGFHGHNDTACAVANTLAAVGAGATHVQGTANGYGERCGNADLFAVVANLETKLDIRVLPEGKLAELQRVAHAVAEIANFVPEPRQPYVGQLAFAHKAGLHASALKTDADFYQHIDPARVGNDMTLLVSELAGRASVELKGAQLGMDVDRDTAGRVIDRVKQRESVGYSYEAAEASFELLLREEVSGSRPQAFTLESWRVIVERRADGGCVSEATVKLQVAGERQVATGEGNGPVNALDNALRAALRQHYPHLQDLELTDYKVRILDGAHGTDAVTRVLVTTSDGERQWQTVGAGDNVIDASWQALDDAVTYGLEARAPVG
ncbi:MAG TPA: citramalate synthase [Mycobacteriales bacterium]|jgi:2-isopropylmalate synthase|nr:citramalate synthase [Mycobacteriales bacterium]